MLLGVFLKNISIYMKTLNMYYTIYKTTNLINNKIYIGLHETEDPEDNYFGSGIFLKKAIKKYGSENFKKDVLFIFNSKEEMIKKEIEIVNEEFIKRKDTYNMSKGGFGLSTLTNEKRKDAVNKIKKSLSDLDLTIRSKKRIESMIKSDENIFKKIGEKSALTQIKSYKNGYINPNTNLNNVHIYNSNNEIEFTCKRSELKSICNENNLPERVLIKSLQQKGTPLYFYQPPTKKEFKKFKGWYALYENEQRIEINEYIKINSHKIRVFKETKKTTCPFDSKNRGKRPCGNYKIFNDKNELIHEFNENAKIKLKQLKLPMNTFLYSYRQNKKVSNGEFLGWSMIKY